MFLYKNTILPLLILPLFVACSTPKHKIANCIYIAKTSEQKPSNLTFQGACGEFLDEDTLVLYPKDFKALFFGKSNLAPVYTKHGVFYVSKTGKVKRTVNFDNGSDYFKEGLVRTISKGKYGFMNDKLEIVIKPQFDFVYPFSDGKARFCNGCKKKSDGEHSIMVGGKWGYVDKNGNITFENKNTF